MYETGKCGILCGKRGGVGKSSLRIRDKKKRCQSARVPRKNTNGNIPCDRPGIDFRHLEVATVMQHLKKQGWIKSLEHKAISKRRPVKISGLANYHRDREQHRKREDKKSKQPALPDLEITELRQ